jgi:hypothetical protein
LWKDDYKEVHVLASETIPHNYFEQVVLDLKTPPEKTTKNY